MSKRKFKSFMDIVLVLLCLMPLIVFLLICTNESINVTTVGDLMMTFCISESLTNTIAESINTFGIEFDGAGFAIACVIMSNSILIYTFYVFVEVLVWLPKFAVRLLERSSNVE